MPYDDTSLLIMDYDLKDIESSVCALWIQFIMGNMHRLYIKVTSTLFVVHYSNESNCSLCLIRVEINVAARAFFYEGSVLMLLETVNC